MSGGTKYRSPCRNSGQRLITVLNVESGATPAAPFGKLLGHMQVQTTARCARLAAMLAPLRR